MEVNSLVIILVAMAIGIMVGFELGQSIMRKRFEELIKKAAEEIRIEMERKKKEQEKAKEEVQQRIDRLAKTWKELVHANDKPVAEPPATENTWTVTFKEKE